MPWHPVALAWSEDGHHVVDHSLSDVEQLALPRGFVVGHARLEQVAGAVHLVLVHVGPAFVEACQGVEGVQVAVGLLGSGDFRRPVVDLSFELGIGMVYQTVGIAFHCLVHIAVVEENARMLAFLAGGVDEVLDASCLVLYLVDADGDGGFHVVLQLRRPEGVDDLDVGEIYLLDHFAL